jgi:hypothetical protein
MLAAGVCAGIVTWRSGRVVARREMVFWSAVSVGAALMTLPVSQPLYRLISPLQVIQFPWRFNVLISLAVTALIGIALDAVRRPLPGEQRIALGIVVAIVVWWIAFTVEPLRATSFNRNPFIAQRIREWLSDKANTPEYRPKWTHVETRELIRQLRGRADTIGRAVIAEGEGAVTVRSWKPRLVSLTLDARTPMTIEVRRFYFPNWVAAATGSTRIAVTPAPSTGLIRMDVPAGAQAVDLRLEPSASERRGIAISALTLAACVGVAAIGMSRGQRREVDPPS